MVPIVLLSREQRGVHLDPGVRGAGDDPAVGVVQRAGGERLAAVGRQVPADDDVRLARRPAARRPGRSSGRARTAGPRGPPTSRRRSPARPRSCRRPQRCTPSKVAGSRRARVRHPQRRDVAAVAADRPGEDPQPVALGAVGAAREAGRERVVAEAGVAAASRPPRRPGAPRRRPPAPGRRPGRWPPARPRRQRVTPSSVVDGHGRCRAAVAGAGSPRRPVGVRDELGQRAGHEAAVAGAGRAVEAGGDDRVSFMP